MAVKEATRYGTEYLSHPQPSVVTLFHDRGEETCTMSIIVDGHETDITLNRRMVFGILVQAVAALRDMEPVK